MVVLGIDAAWTRSQPTGVALVRKTEDRWETLVSAPSYSAFIACKSCDGVDWSATLGESEADVEGLIDSAEALAGEPVDLVSTAEPAGTLRRTIDVYPHPALLSLLNATYRIPCKVSRSRRYWPTKSVSERFGRLLEQFERIRSSLEAELGDPGFILLRGKRRWT